MSVNDLEGFLKRATGERQHVLEVVRALAFADGTVHTARYQIVSQPSALHRLLGVYDQLLTTLW